MLVSSDLNLREGSSPTVSVMCTRKGAEASQTTLRACGLQSQQDHESQLDI